MAIHNRRHEKKKKIPHKFTYKITSYLVYLNRTIQILVLNKAFIQLSLILEKVIYD